MSLWRGKVAKRAAGGNTEPVAGRDEEEAMQPLTEDTERAARNVARREKRTQMAASRAELDKLAHQMRADGRSYEAIAEELGYANGAIARRAVLRHIAAIN